MSALCSPGSICSGSRHLVSNIVGYKIKGKGVQAGLVRWEAQFLALERDHKETLSPKVRRALLMNLLPVSMQSRIMEHLGRLKTYAAVREKIIALCQSSIDEADIGGVDSNGIGNDLGAWGGWWQDEVGAWREPEQMLPGEQSADIH